MIIFVRNPIPGKVKTRLALTLGDANALKIYERLLWHTASITSNIHCDKFVYYADFVTEADCWDPKLYLKRLQNGIDLGARMKHAFEEVFNLSYSQAVIIGSDCYELNESIIERAFFQLREADCVIGPSLDGGYYLLGLKNMEKTLFINKHWSSANVMEDSIRDLEASGLSYSLLPTLRDVDVEADVPAEIRRDLL